LREEGKNFKREDHSMCLVVYPVLGRIEKRGGKKLWEGIGRKGNALQKGKFLVHRGGRQHQNNAFDYTKHR